MDDDYVSKVFPNLPPVQSSIPIEVLREARKRVDERDFNEWLSAHTDFFPENTPIEQKRHHFFTVVRKEQEAEIVRQCEEAQNPSVISEDVKCKAPVIPRFELPEYLPLVPNIDIFGRKFTDVWNADRFTDRFESIVRYCNPQKIYYIWNGRLWEPDKYGKIRQLCEIVIHDLIRDPQAHECIDLLKHLVKSYSPTGVRNMMFFLEANRIPVSESELNVDEDRINVLNGVINLANREYELPDRNRFITRLMNVTYDPSAKCPQWEAHLNLIFDGDQATIKSFQMISGYSLLRKNPEQLFFILWGLGENGKSVTVNVLSYIIAEYAMNADPRTFMHRRSDDTTVRSDIARLYPAHFVTAVESGNDVRLNEGLLKAITGHDKITARELYEKEQEKPLEAKVWFITNIEPVIKDNTHGMLRRIIKIPFSVQIPPDKRDDRIEQKLYSESSGIFNWLLKGLDMWYKNGRKIIFSKAITDATEQYRSSIDEYRDFFSEDVKITENPKDEMPKRTLLEYFCMWYSDKYGEYPTIKLKEFNQICREHGFKKDKRIATGYVWVGVKHLTQADRDNMKKEESDNSSEKSYELVNQNEPYPVSPKTLTLYKKLPDNVHRSSQVHYSGVTSHVCSSLCGEPEQSKCKSDPSKCGRGHRV